MNANIRFVHDEQPIPTVTLEQALRVEGVYAISGRTKDRIVVIKNANNEFVHLFVGADSIQTLLKESFKDVTLYPTKEKVSIVFHS